MKIFNGISELASAAGTELGSSEWTVVDQKRIDTFADATGDHQWIHVDPEKAAACRSAGLSRTACSRCRWCQHSCLRYTEWMAY